MVPAIILSVSAAVAQPTDGFIRFSNRVESDDAELTLQEVADLSSLPTELRAKAASLRLAVLAENAQSVILEHAYLASRARSLLPALAPWLQAGGTGQLSVVQSRFMSSSFGATCGVDGIKKGQRVSVHVSLRGIMVQRRAEALQSAGSGQGFFARTSDGSVLKATCEVPE